MLCDVDVGNTRIKWRFEGESNVFTSEDPAALTQDCIQRGVTRVRVSDVSSREKMAASWQLLDGLGVAVTFARVTPGIAGVRLAYKDYLSFGVDRWLALLAARACQAEDMVLISAGTAVTVDYMRADGQHLGGLIAPGLRLSANALLTGTYGVGSLEIQLPKNWRPGETTLNCVESGFSAMFTGLLSSVLSWADDNMSLPKIIMTGGDAAKLQALISPYRSSLIQPALVLDGLAVAFSEGA